MPHFSKTEVFQKLKDFPVIPLFYHGDLEVCKQVVVACYRGGTRVIEFTNRGEKAIEVFRELIPFCRENCPELALGIGTIFTADQARLFVGLGADFIVQPMMNPEVAIVCHENGLHWLPGVATLTEVYNAELRGAEVVKLFPGNILGPDFIKAMKGPMPHTKMMVTGGVEPTEESLNTWFSAGAMCVGIGSQLLPKAVLDSGDWNKLEEKISFVMSLVGRRNTPSK